MVIDLASGLKKNEWNICFFCNFILYTRYLLWTTLLSIAEHFLMCFLVCNVGILNCPLEYCRSMMSRTPTRELTLALPSTRSLMQKEHCPLQSYAIVKRLSSRSSILHQVRSSKSSVLCWSLYHIDLTIIIDCPHIPRLRVIIDRPHIPRLRVIKDSSQIPPLRPGLS